MCSYLSRSVHSSGEVFSKFHFNSMSIDVFLCPQRCTGVLQGSTLMRYQYICFYIPRDMHLEFHCNGMLNVFLCFKGSLQTCGNILQSCSSRRMHVLCIPIWLTVCTTPEQLSLVLHFYCICLALFHPFMYSGAYWCSSLCTPMY